MTKLFFSCVLIMFSHFALCQTWSAVGSGLNGYGRIEAMCEYDGELYVGGYFDSIAGFRVYGLARWNGSNWDSVPGMTSFGSEIFDMVVYQGELYTVGNGVHKWNGTAWTTNVGGWIDNRQFAVEVYDNELYITGHFENAGGIPTRGIARWNGVAWNSVGGAGLNLGPGFSGNDLKTYNGELYLVGGFGLISGTYAECFARWDGTIWSTVGIASNVWEPVSLESYNNKLYAGGNTQINGNTKTEWICRWDSNVWDSVGIDLNNRANVMEVYNGELYVAGDFDTAGGSQALGIARWDDTNWNTVGSGLDLFLTNVDTLIFSPYDTIFFRKEGIMSMCTFNNELYVGGTFGKIGGIYANSIAKWHVVGAGENEIELSEIEIYPNPARSILKVDLGKWIHDKTKLEIKNALGQTIYCKTIEQTTQQLELDIETFSNGVFFLFISSGENSVVKKFIKQ